MMCLCLLVTIQNEGASFSPGKNSGKSILKEWRKRLRKKYAQRTNKGLSSMEKILCQKQARDLARDAWHFGWQTWSWARLQKW